MPRRAEFEIYRGASGQFRWRLRAANGEIVATGEAYTSKDACKNGIRSVRRSAAKAVLQDLTK